MVIFGGFIPQKNDKNCKIMAVIPKIETVICMTCSLVYNPKACMELINHYILPYVESA